MFNFTLLGSSLFHLRRWFFKFRWVFYFSYPSEIYLRNQIWVFIKNPNAGILGIIRVFAKAQWVSLIFDWDNLRHNTTMCAIVGNPCLSPRPWIGLQGSSQIVRRPGAGRGLVYRASPPYPSSAATGVKGHYITIFLLPDLIISDLPRTAAMAPHRFGLIGQIFM